VPVRLPGGSGGVRLLSLLGSMLGVELLLPEETVVVETELEIEPEPELELEAAARGEAHCIECVYGEMLIKGHFGAFLGACLRRRVCIVGESKDGDGV
jgi:hypothetical protein